MKRSIHIRVFVTFLLVLAMLSPTAIFAFDGGKKHFQTGMKHEAAEEWDKAVEEFALALSDSPKNVEYRLHLTRALFNASQMYVKKGTLLAKEKNYEEAYTAFRRAYAFDPTNELAKSEMERMVRLQKDLNDLSSPGGKKDLTGGVKMIPTGYVEKKDTPQIPQKLEKLRDLPFPSGVDLQFIIKELAKDLDLNVLFDSASFRQPNRKTYIDLKNVTAARALDYIFLQEALFFQKVGPRTILIANQTERQKFQQLVLRTFYLANASPKDVAKVVQTAIPAQPGRSQTIVLTDDATNSITVRDTEENIRLIGKLIASLDKDRAEVVMDVAIYEVRKDDLLQLGNQIGGQGSLTNLGGTTSGVVDFTRGDNIFGILGHTAANVIPSVLAAGLNVPSSTFQAYNEKKNSKLIASTQIHAFNNEDSSARIGQRVPVKSASFVTGNTPGSTGVVSNVVNYEQVGLTLKFKPLVFPNQDVQVAMEIESKSVDRVTCEDCNPSFTERSIKGTARIQNNKTLLLASVAQGQEDRSRSGLPLLGLIPILGRLFTAPSKGNAQVDIVIAVTPRVIRAPAILPEDEIERPTGSLMSPTNSSLEAMIIQDEHDEMLAAARRVPNQTEVQLPDRTDAPVYVRTENASNTSTKGTDTAAATTAQTTAAQTAPAVVPVAINNNIKPIDSGVKTLQLNQTSDTSTTTKPETVEAQPVSSVPVDAKTEPLAAPNVQLLFGSDFAERKAGEKIQIPVVIQGSSAFRSGVIGIKYDDKRIAVRSVSFGDVFGGTLVNTAATPFLNQNGKMYVSLSAKDETGAKAYGTLVFIEIEALVDGRPEITFDRDVLNFLTLDGKNFQVRLEK